MKAYRRCAVSPFLYLPGSNAPTAIMYVADGVGIAGDEVKTRCPIRASNSGKSVRTQILYFSDGVHKDYASSKYSV